MTNSTRTKNIQEILASCPASGEGVHKWLFKTALKLHLEFPDKDELCRVLTDATVNCGREVTAREIEGAVYNSLPDENGEVKVCGPRWPGPNRAMIAGILRQGPSLADLKAASPVRWTDGQPHTEEIIDALFPGNPLLCTSGRKEASLTRLREQSRRYLDRQQFIVPSPMSSVFGTTQDGKRSMRTKSNVGPRRYIVVEFDQGTFDDHAKILVHLSKYLPLVLAVHSGKKSLHGWFPCAGLRDEQVERFFRYAVSLGADSATWTPCQLVRMPDGLRDGVTRQRTVFFNPQTLSKI